MRARGALRSLEGLELAGLGVLGGVPRRHVLALEARGRQAQRVEGRLVHVHLRARREVVTHVKSMWT